MKATEYKYIVAEILLIIHSLLYFLGEGYNGI